LRFFDFLPLFKILFAAAGGDLSYETASKKSFAAKGGRKKLHEVLN
jgi:hypothetical protein